MEVVDKKFIDDFIVKSIEWCCEHFGYDTNENLRRHSKLKRWLYKHYGIKE